MLDITSDIVKDHNNKIYCFTKHQILTIHNLMTFLPSIPPQKMK